MIRFEEQNGGLVNEGSRSSAESTNRNSKGKTLVLHFSSPPSSLPSSLRISCSFFRAPFSTSSSFFLFLIAATYITFCSSTIFLSSYSAASSSGSLFLVPSHLPTSFLLSIYFLTACGSNLLNRQLVFLPFKSKRNLQCFFLFQRRVHLFQSNHENDLCEKVTQKFK